MRLNLVPALLLAALLPGPAAAQCTLAGQPHDFGAALSPQVPNNAFDLDVFQGGQRLIVTGQWGFGLATIWNDGSVHALPFTDLSSPSYLGQCPGDCFTYMSRVAGSADGKRILASVSPFAPIGGAIAGYLNGNSYTLAGYVPPPGAKVVIQQWPPPPATPTRYIAFSLADPSGGGKLRAADITAQKPALKTPITTEISTFPGGSGLIYSVPYLVYQSNGSVVVVNASNPGPAPVDTNPSITANFGSAVNTTTITKSQFGAGAGETMVTFGAAVDPADGAAAPRLFVLAEFRNASGPTGFRLVKLEGGTVTPIGSRFLPPDPYSGTGAQPGYSIFALKDTSDVSLFMWTAAGSGARRLYSTTVRTWGAPPQAADVITGDIAAMRVIKPTPTTAVAYVANTTTALAIPLSCQPISGPAIAGLSVEPVPCPAGQSSPCPLPADGSATAFVGDSLKVSTSVLPMNAYQSINGWRLDLDYHAAAEYNGPTYPSLAYPDYSGSGDPPASYTLVGPCDKNIGGANPADGTNCWASVQANGAFGGPDYATPNPAPGSTKALQIALEGNNDFTPGSAGATTFTVNWKVPAVRLKATSILLGNPLEDGSEGHPVASAYTWYFGTNPAAPAGETLTPYASCTGPTCNPVPGGFLAARGTYNVWLVARYPGGYQSPDCGSPCYSSGGSPRVTVTDIIPTFTINDSTAPPTVISRSMPTIPVTETTTQQSGAVTNKSYEFCINTSDAAGSCAIFTPFSISGGSGSVPTPPAVGNYYLRINVKYQISGINHSAPWVPGVAGVADPAAWPVQVVIGALDFQFTRPPVDFCFRVGQECTDAIWVVELGATVTATPRLDGAYDPNPENPSWSVTGIPASPSSGSQPIFAFTPTSIGLATVNYSAYGIVAAPVKLLVYGTLPTALVSGDGTICQGGSHAIHAALTGSPPWNLYWSDGATQTGVSASPATRNVSPLAQTTYTLTRVSNLVGNGTTSGSAVVTVVGDPVPPPPAVTAPVWAAAGTAGLVASVPPYAGHDFQWTVTNGTLTAGQGTSQITFTAGSPGPLTIEVVERNSCGNPSPVASAAVDVLSPGAPARFYTLPPCRIFDTRAGSGPAAAAPSLVAGASRLFDIAARCGVPPTARSLSVNLAVTGAAGSGHLTLYPGNGSAPLASTINFTAGQTRANNAILTLATDGSSRIGVKNGSGGTVDFILDVNGYFQ